MKRYLLIFVMSLLCWKTCSAQWKLTPGLFISQFGSVDLKDINKGFSPAFNPMLALNLEKDQASYGFNGLYSMSSNSIGAAYYYNFNEKFGAYTLGFKSTRNRTGFAVAGVSYSVMGGHARLFADLGTDLPDTKGVFLELGTFLLLFP